MSLRVIAAVLALSLVGCGTSEPTPSPSTGAASSVPSSAPTSGVPPEGPPACLDAKLVWADAIGRLLLANCLDQFNLDSLETVWAWDGSAWELLSDDGPPGHVVTGVAWDADRDVLVRYGGIPLPEQACDPVTWEWDMTAWREVGTEPPDACDHIELMWDASASRVLLVGGGRAQDLAAGTWGWDGNAWNRLTDAGPAPRAHHGLMYPLLYGGLDNTRVFDDGWEWDGGTWNELATVGPSPGPRSHHGFAVGTGGALLFGGARSTSTFGSLVDETWLLRDGAWTRLEGAGPSARGLPALGFDPDREVYVLHGGFDAEGTPLADTWEWDGAWRCIIGC